ncbi:DNA (cytosine-5-)-methyltransferase [Spiroplasma endosymbiont of Crioceris asparagi]|uniref:DNA (cytosine-5-)-methyltransferase n=1 Tax=Spiroplasma endosymbiont of Crioceris asparagi TaxID=3066286 RepID=UPI0030D1CBCC
MKQFNVIEFFSGIGAQKKALEILKENKILDYKIVGTSDWDVWANISYNLIHNKNDNNEISEEEIDDFLSKFTHSLDSKNPTNFLKIKQLDFKIKKLLYDAYKNSNNMGSIINIDGKKLPKCDILTYSFPCQDLSNAGKNLGMSKESNTRSGLLWEVERILEEANQENNLPRYLLLENVRNLVSSRHSKEYIEWLEKLKSLGYSTKTYLLNSFNYGSVQKRIRVFALSILDGDKINFVDDYFKNKKLISEENPKDISSNLKLKQSLEKIIDISYTKYLHEAKEAIPNDTPSRKKIYDKNPKIFSNNKEDIMGEKTKTKNGYYSRWVRTITTKQDRHPNAGVISIKKSKIDEGKNSYRFLTPRETFKIMGFSNNDFDKIKEKEIIRNDVLYRQAGNSIVVNVLVAIFNEILIAEKKFGELNE